MQESESKHLRLAYAALKALRDNIPDDPHHARLSENYAQQFHEALLHLLSAGYTYSQFDIPDEWLKKRWVGRSGAGEDRWTSERYVERGLLLSKIDTVLNYFELSPEHRKAVSGGRDEFVTVAGFKGPRTEKQT